MEAHHEPAVVSYKAPSKTLAAIFAAAFIAVCVVALIALVNANSPAGQQAKIALPKAVTSANCRAVATSANLLHAKLSGPAIGKYYSAWVTKLADQQKVTRTTLFDAGIAVAVCLQ